MVDQGSEPRAQPGLHHGGRLIDIVGADRGAGSRGGSEPQQGPFGVRGDGPAEQLPLAFEGDVVGALCRGQRSDDDADDGDRDDNAKRHEHAEACPVPSGRFGSFSRTARRRGCHPRHKLLRELLSWITAGYAAIIAIGLRIADPLAESVCRARRNSAHGVNQW